MGGLAAKAAVAAGRVEAPADDEEAYVPDLSEPDLGDLTKDAESASPIVAWSRVMGEIRSIGKSRDFDGGRAGKFKFRGIEEALNAFGPACRKHGVLVIQHKVTAEYRDIKTSSDGTRRECTVTVVFRIYGPDGSFFETEAMGEASDSGGRATPKAQSIALRTMLINNGLVPTQDRDADRDHFERGEAPVRSAASYLTEVLDPATSAMRLRQIYSELVRTRQKSALVTNEIGQSEEIGELVTRIGKERARDARTAGGWHEGHDAGGFSADCAACRAESAAEDQAVA